MSKQIFNDGSVLLTGKDMEIAMEAMINHRGRYDISCEFCIHEGDDVYCEGCTILDLDSSCSCHICPPCSKCVGSKFEVSPCLINYIHHKNGRKRWECFKGYQQTFEKLTLMEEKGFHLSAETLTTGEIAMYVEDGEIDYEIEICNQIEFKQTMSGMVHNFNLNTTKYKDI